MKINFKFDFEVKRPAKSHTGANQFFWTTGSDTATRCPQKTPVQNTSSDWQRLAVASALAICHVGWRGTAAGSNGSVSKHIKGQIWGGDRHWQIIIFAAVYIHLPKNPRTSSYYHALRQIKRDRRDQWNHQIVVSLCQVTFLSVKIAITGISSP